MIGNLQGDVIGIWNQSGTKVITYTYDAWGRVIVSVRDITTDKEGLLALAEACNRLSLSPIHLYDVIEDYLVEN